MMYPFLRGPSKLGPGRAISWVPNGNIIGPLALVLLASISLSQGSADLELQKRYPHEPLPLKWRPFNVRDASPSEDNEVMSLFDVKDFVKGLKSRITSEISILLAIDPEASLDLENDPNSSMKSRSNPSNRNQVRDFITDNGRTNLRKFLPIPLLLGGRTRRN